MSVGGSDRPASPIDSSPIDSSSFSSLSSSAVVPSSSSGSSSSSSTSSSVSPSTIVSNSISLLFSISSLALVSFVVSSLTSNGSDLTSSNSTLISLSAGSIIVGASDLSIAMGLSFLFVLLLFVFFDFLISFPPDNSSPIGDVSANSTPLRASLLVNNGLFLILLILNSWFFCSSDKVSHRS